MAGKKFDPDQAENDFRRDAGLKLLTTFWFLAVLAVCGYALMAIRNEWWPYDDLNIANSATEKQVMYAFVGGVIGAAVFAFHGFCVAAGPQVYDNPKWHYDPNWTWWYIASPPLGGFLALIAYFLVKAGVGQLGTEATDTQSNVGFLAVGALAGFSTKRVLAWLDTTSGGTFPGSTGSGGSNGGQARQDEGNSGTANTPATVEALWAPKLHPLESVL
jgi:hypothetical protein